MVYEFTGPLVASHPLSLYEGATYSAGPADALHSHPLSQGKLICLQEAGHRFRDESLTPVTFDTGAFLVLSVSVKMTSGPFMESL